MQQLVVADNIDFTITRRHLAECLARGSETAHGEGELHHDAEAHGICSNVFLDSGRELWRLRRGLRIRRTPATAYYALGCPR